MAPTPSPAGAKGDGGGGPTDDNPGPKSNVPLIAIIIVLIVAVVFFASLAVCIYRRRQARERKRKRVAQHYARMGKCETSSNGSDNSDRRARGHRSDLSNVSMSVCPRSESPLPALPSPVYEVPRVETHFAGPEQPPSYKPVDADTRANNPWE